MGQSNRNYANQMVAKVQKNSCIINYNNNLKGYLLTIARNICFNYLRDKKEKKIWMV